MVSKAGIHVTFDRNVCNAIRSRLRKEKSPDKDVYTEILAQIRAGTIYPYLSEATLTFELFCLEERLLILASYFACAAERPKLPQPSAKAEQWVRDLLAIGFRVLRGPSRIGLSSSSFINLNHGWAEDLRFPLEKRLERATNLIERFEQLGPSRLKRWGNELAKAHGLDRTTHQNDYWSPCPKILWFEGLMAEYQKPRCCSSKKDFFGKLRKIFSDWFDLDAVASHYGYGLDYFCTDEIGRGTVGDTIFHPDNLKILEREFNVHVVSAEELSMIALTAAQESFRGNQGE